MARLGRDNIEDMIQSAQGDEYTSGGTEGTGERHHQGEPAYTSGDAEKTSESDHEDEPSPPERAAFRRARPSNLENRREIMSNLEDRRWFFRRCFGRDNVGENHGGRKNHRYNPATSYDNADRTVAND